MQITFEIKNINKLMKALGEARFKNIIQDAISNSTERLLGTAKEYIIGGHNYSRAPYDTGKMYSTMAKTILPAEGRVYPTVNYAYYVHEGRSTSTKYGRRPFLEDALKETKKFVEDEIKRLTDDELRRMARKIS